MPADNAHPFTTSLGDSLIGSSPFRPTPVDSPASAGRDVSYQTPRRMSKRWCYCIPSDGRFGTLRHDKPPLSIFFVIPDRLQPSSAPPIPETCSKSAGCHPAAAHFTESLGESCCERKDWAGGADKRLVASGAMMIEQIELA